MSEVRYRSQLRQLFTLYGFYPEQASFIDALLSSGLPIPEQLARILEGDPCTDWQSLSQAIHTIAQLRLNNFELKLASLFEATDVYSLQFDILNALRTMDCTHISPFLLSVGLNKQHDAAIRCAAIGSLRKKWPDMIAPLLATAQDTSDHPTLRGMAIHTLAMQDDKSLLPAILALLNDAETEVRYNAVYALSILGDASLAAYIEPLLTDTTPVNSAPTMADYARQVLEKWASTKEEKPDNSV